MAAATIFERRVNRLRRVLARKRLDAILVWDRANTRYLAGFRGTASLICITTERAYFLTDFRYLQIARSSVPHMRVVDNRASEVQCLARILKRNRARKVGFEPSVPYRLYKTWSDKLDGIELAEAGELIQALRERKQRDEVRRIVAAQRIAEKALESVLPACKPGISEIELARRLAHVIDELGAEGVAFEPIVASGPNAALPHAEPGERRLRKGDLVIFDLGAVVDGYCSDMTRTFVIGRANERQRKVYRIVLDAQKRAISRIRDGAPAASVDRAARRWIESHGYGKRFGHGTGHGVGLEIHELPSLKAESRDVLRQGMVVTVEPGIYLNGWGGVRIEDMVLVKRGGRENLTAFPKRLIELPCD